jgi:hypothetical protein
MLFGVNTTSYVLIPCNALEEYRETIEDAIEINLTQEII